MPKFVSVSLPVGRRIRLKGVCHRVTGFERLGASVVLVRDDGTDEALSMPRSELYAQIVEETAQLVDDTEDPDITASMPEINLSFLSIDRAIDWWHKMILLRKLLAQADCSPRSKRFEREYNDACHLLEWVRANSGIGSLKTWSRKTLNDDLRRWRRAGFSIAALQVKGLQYRPWKKRSPKYERARTLAQNIREDPNWTVESVRRMTRHLLRRDSIAPETNAGVPPDRSAQATSGVTR